MRILFTDTNGLPCLIETDRAWIRGDEDRYEGMAFADGLDGYICRDITRAEAEMVLRDLCRTGNADLSRYRFEEEFYEEEFDDEECYEEDEGDQFPEDRG